MKTSFDGLTSRVNAAGERISVLKGTPVKTSKPEEQRQKDLGKRKQNRISRTMEQLQKVS
jgi:hypothetical protein